MIFICGYLAELRSFHALLISDEVPVSRYGRFCERILRYLTQAR